MRTYPKTLISILAVSALAALLAATACTSSAASSSAASASASASSASSASSSASASNASSSAASSGATTTDAEDVVTIDLDYSAGTGFEWFCEIDPEGIVAEIDHTTENLAKDKDIDGGPLCDHYTFRATSPGEVVITFTLARGWEKDAEPAETQTYAFTVSDDLKMILNPYKSDFDHEPTWGSNA